MPLLRSAGVRLALVYALLFGLSALALILFLWWQTASLLNGQTEVAVRADAQVLMDRYTTFGARELLHTIAARVSDNVDPDAIYLLADEQLRPLAGNLLSWPPSVNVPEKWYEFDVLMHGSRVPARLQRYALGNGWNLLVGRDVRGRTVLRRLLGTTLITSSVLVVLISVGGALALQRVLSRMLMRVSVTAEAIAAGDLAQRVRVSGRGDEIDRVAETINVMLDRIGRLMAGVRQVSDSIAHDLRTPIARARARLEDAVDRARGADEMRTACAAAIADLDGITAVFQALLRISEIEAGGRRQAFAPFDAAVLLAGLAELYEAPAEETGIRLSLEAPGPLHLSGDPAMVQQAVANLLDNALKFSPPGGTVRLRGRVAPGTVEVVVEDHGPGIAEADRARATQRFFRGDTARHTQGYGLGLALVRAVAQLHGGTLRLEDARPGLLATISLPA